jgi:exodeoxyribonuclease-3
VLCLQEIKTTDEQFPREDFVTAGYQVLTHGQRAYNGVATLTRRPPSRVAAGLPGDDTDLQARALTVTLDGLDILNLYVPNGEAVGSDKFAYKLRWLERLVAHVRDAYDPASPLVLCGDFNIAPADADVYAPGRLKETVMFHSAEQAQLERLRQWGLEDLFRRVHPHDRDAFSWWDYRMNAFARNQGYRIDHVWATTPVAARCVDVRIDTYERSKVKPSDHAPVIAYLSE